MNLILASQSRARQNMLHATRLEFEVRPAVLDEQAIIEPLIEGGAKPGDLAIKLAKEKALAVSKAHSGALVIGSDQILECEGKILSKAENEEEAKDKLRFLRGKPHILNSAVAVARDGDILWEVCASVTLKMKNFDEKFLEEYCACAGDVLTTCVGAYEYETSKEELFENYPDEEDKNNYFTILGMPLLPLVRYLQDEHGAIIQ